MKGIFITGTDTNIGKTWLSVKLITTLRKQGFNITPRKPVESGWSPDISQTDAWKLANAANKLDQLDAICPNHFTHAISPARAAMMNGRQLNISTLAKQCLPIQKQQNTDEFLIVEGAGGFYSPLAHDGLNSDLARTLDLPVLLVAENRLGCINQVLLSTNAIKATFLQTAVVVLNNPTEKSEEEDFIGKNNLEDLRTLLDCPVISLDHNEKKEAIFVDIAKLIISP